MEHAHRKQGQTGLVRPWPSWRDHRPTLLNLSPVNPSFAQSLFAFGFTGSTQLGSSTLGTPNMAIQWMTGRKQMVYSRTLWPTGVSGNSKGPFQPL
ncbi:hypothetical protein SAMN04488056_10683 [Cohaesibacter marisflavi]|uniref:Uncharacterized protein n=1 Tax=Cohaesibacter marisflavi TaxID=655353 RepID=A0A1I5H828_9HYPH|nr:hypothetical protein SAMN04488056_10683 [Cohaesibacter marisflavi]